MSNKEPHELTGLQRYLIMGVLGSMLLICISLCLSAWIYEGPRRLIVKLFKEFRSNTKL